LYNRATGNHEIEQQTGSRQSLLEPTDKRPHTHDGSVADETLTLTLT